MLKYSCTNSRLVNWVLRQVSDQPGMIFPIRKGWEARLKLYYPCEQNKAFFLVLVTNRTELLVFIPLDSKTRQSHLKFFCNPKLIQTIQAENTLQVTSQQLIFLACEKDNECVSSLLESTIQSFNLMMLDYEKMSFVHGNFQNPRLEYRLTSQEFDTDLIPNLLPETQQTISDGITNALFYQNLFFNLNRYWVSGAVKVQLRAVLKDSIPYWKHYRKRDQQEIVDHIGAELEQVFNRFSFAGFAIEFQGKKSESVPATVVRLPVFPDSKKELNIWSRKLDSALEFFRNEAKQISIDALDLDSVELNNIRQCD